MDNMQFFMSYSQLSKFPFKLHNPMILLEVCSPAFVSLCKNIATHQTFQPTYSYKGIYNVLCQAAIFPSKHSKSQQILLNISVAILKEFVGRRKSLTVLCFCVPPNRGQAHLGFRLKTNEEFLRSARNEFTNVSSCQCNGEGSRDETPGADFVVCFWVLEEEELGARWGLWEGRQRRSRGEKVLEDVHLMPRSTCLVLTTENTFHSLSLREPQGCWLGRGLGSLGADEQDSWAGGPHLSFLRGSVGRRPTEAAGGSGGLLHLGQTLRSSREWGTQLVYSPLVGPKICL